MEHVLFLGNQDSDPFFYVMLLNPFLLCNASSEFFWDDGLVSHFWMVGALLDVPGMWSDAPIWMTWNRGVVNPLNSWTPGLQSRTKIQSGPVPAFILLLTEL